MDFIRDRHGQRKLAGGRYARCRRMKMKKRERMGLFWKMGCLCAGLGLLPGVVPAEEVTPNILFIMVDDLAPDAVFEERFPFLETPHLERLSQEGAVFENMFVTTSLCSPSRASILTGTYAHIHGVRYNEIQDPDPSLPQFPQVLQELGYATALIGKWHMEHHADPRPTAARRAARAAFTRSAG